MSDKKNALSHSAMSKFQDCAKSYYYRYVERIVSQYKSGALYFGSALDEALNEVLKAEMPDVEAKDPYETFERWWDSQPDNDGNWEKIAKNPDVVYSNTDYDGDLMEKSDWAKAFRYRDELGLSGEPWELFDAIKQEKKERGWPNIEERRRQFYNYMNWLAMRRKGFLMLDAYKEQVLPHIAEVLAVQKYVKLVNSEGDYVRGFVDAVVRWEDGSVVCLDNKTSSIDYEFDAVLKSPQLALYQIIMNNEAADSEHPWEHEIEKCGYAVLHKRMRKDITKTCVKCGYEAEKGARHKTCSAETEDGRCGGKWARDVKFNVATQILVDKVPEHVIQIVKDNVSAINTEIKQNLKLLETAGIDPNRVFARNFNACKKPWGLCEYYAKCWNNSDEGLISRGNDNVREQGNSGSQEESDNN